MVDTFTEMIWQIEFVIMTATEMNRPAEFQTEVIFKKRFTTLLLNENMAAPLDLFITLDCAGDGYL